MRNTRTTLTHEECLQRLAHEPMGRIAVTHRALPVIVPVPYALSGHSIVFRTEADGMLARACINTVVAFEIDGPGSAATARWSVMVIGIARLLDGSRGLGALELGLAASGDNVPDQFVAITIGEVSGRQVSPATSAMNRAARDAS